MIFNLNLKLSGKLPACYLTFTVQGAAVQTGRKVRTSMVISSIGHCRLQYQTDMQDVPTGTNVA